MSTSGFRYTVVFSYSASGDWNEADAYTLHVTADSPERAADVACAQIGDRDDCMVHATFAGHHDSLVED